ncbi:MarR family winged helix-turn-helix transcriptional regulator [Paenibacillus swuensis]|uniref:MarR family winged helix-turn-helix transcriptional regulator n=1 Tax=Paenibacillus swuensis TaxID=1178515 RepID=UPI00083988FD|nr:MarR family transcriptional regulator [Paenibacillus swuensis]
MHKDKSHEGEHKSDTDRFQMALFTTVRRIGPDLVKQSELGITSNQFYILKFLMHRGTCRLTKLAEWMEVKPSAITVVVDRLENHGFVKRMQDPTDRRAILVELTYKGHFALAKLDEIRTDAIEKLLSVLQEGEKEAFIQTFEKLVQAATSQQADGNGSCIVTDKKQHIKDNKGEFTQ